MKNFVKINNFLVPIHDIEYISRNEMSIVVKLRNDTLVIKFGDKSNAEKVFNEITATLSY